MAFEIPEDPTTVTFAEYAALDIDERSALIDIVYERNTERIEQLLGQKAWFLVCGPNFSVVEEAESWEEVLTDGQVWDKGQEIGFAPYQFFADDVIEDLVTV